MARIVREMRPCCPQKVAICMHKEFDNILSLMLKSNYKNE